MADQKITQLTALAATPDDADILAIVDDVAGTPVTKKVTVANLLAGAGEKPRMYFSYGFESLDSVGVGKKYISDLTGSGAINLTTGGFELDLGVTDASEAKIKTQVAGGYSLGDIIYNNNPEIQGILKLTTSGIGNFVSIFCMGSNGGVPSSSGVFTSEHFGFILDTAVLNASNSNDTTQTITDISSGITMTATNIFRAILSSSVNVKFYINKTLKATHTTNLPTGNFGMNLWNAGVKNDSGVTNDRSLILGHVTISWDAE